MRARLLLLAVLVANGGVSCTGAIGEGDEREQRGPGSSGPSASGGAGSGSTPGSGPGSSGVRPQPGTFTGPIVSEPGPASRFVRLSHRQWENTVRDALRLAEPL